MFLSRLRRSFSCKKGDDRADHFSHYHPDTVNKECSWGYETELHLLAKEVIYEQKRIILPIGTFEPAYETINFDIVELEVRADNRIPDLIGHYHGDKIHIEIAVTHFCDHEKIAELKTNNTSCVEIDLSELVILDDLIDKELIRAELEEPKIKWLSINPFGLFADKTYNHNRLKSIELIHKIKTEKDQLESSITILQRKLTELQHQESMLSKNIKTTIEALENKRIEIEDRSEELDALNLKIKNNQILVDKIINSETLESKLNEKILIQLDLIKRNDLHLNNITEFKNKIIADSRDIAKNREQTLQDLNKKITEILDREKNLDQRYKDINTHIETKANEIANEKFTDLLKNKQNIISKLENEIQDAEARIQSVKRKYRSYVKF